MSEQYLRYGGANSQRSTGDIIPRFVDSWYARATVRRPWEWQPALDPLAPDFLESLLPFNGDQEFKQSSDGTKASCLSAGWLIYNYKTIEIETQIIIPACIDLMELSTSSRLSYDEVSALAETITDEGFHTLISAELCRMTSSFRNLDVRVPDFDLTRRLKAYRLVNATRLFSLARLAFATVSEIFISDYLSLLSGAQEIQPLFRSAVTLHKADEVCHKRLFPRLIRGVIRDCNEEERKFFVKAIHDAVQSFSSRETRIWRDVLGQIYSARPDCDGRKPPECAEMEGEADFTGVSELLTDLGLSDNDSYRMSNSLVYA